MIQIAFFGCWGKAGHFLFDKDGNHIRGSACGLPEEQLDGSPLLLPHPEVPGAGQCTYLPAWDVTVLSWWNRVFDTRSAVNSHVLCRGHVEPSTMWAIFQHNFPKVAAHHTKPVIKVVY